MDSNPAAIHAHVSALPRNLFSEMATLGERQRNLQRMREKCKMQMLEVRKRSETLQQYASELVEMDKQLRSAENEFEEDYDTKLGEISDQEEEYLHQLARIREEKQQNEQRLKSYVQMSSIMLNTIAETTKEEMELKATKMNIESLTTKTKEQIAQLSIEKIEFEVDQQRKEVEKLSKQLDEKRKLVNHIESQSSELMTNLNSVLQKKKETGASKTNAEETCTTSASSLRSQINKSKDEYQQIMKREIKLMAQQKVIQKEIQRVSDKLAKKQQEKAMFDRTVQPHKEKLEKDQKKLEDVRSETKRYIAAVDRQHEFLKGIGVSTQRAQLRGQEIENSRKLIAKQLKQTQIDKFVIEEEIESQNEHITEIQSEITEIEEDEATFHKEEEEVNEEFNATSMNLSIHQDTENQYQELIDATHNVYRSLKDKIALMRKDEKQILRRMMELKDKNIIPTGEEIEEVKRRSAVLVKGYETQTAYTRDQCAKLRLLVKNEELKINVGQSEHRRINTSFNQTWKSSIIATNSEILDNDDPVSVLDEKQSKRQSKLLLLAAEVKHSERKRDEIQARLTNKKLSIMNKSSEIAHNSQLIPDEEDVPGEDDALQKRSEIAQEFCKAAQIAISNIESSIKDWSKMTQESAPSAIKQWYQTLSGIIDRAEDIEMRFTVL